MFGLHVDRPRLFATNFPVHLDRVFVAGIEELRPHTHLGRRGRWGRADPYGRVKSIDCCEGNLEAVQGYPEGPGGAERWARAMGIDPDHMPPSELVEAIPPAYAQLIFGQMAMHFAHARYGCPVVTFDEATADPSKRREVLMWARGAGAMRVGGEQTTLSPAGASASGETAADATGGSPELEDDHEPDRLLERQDALERCAGRRAEWGCVDWGLRESSFRELEYSPGGNFTQVVLDPGAPNWLEPIRMGRQMGSTVRPEDLHGRSTYIHVGTRRLRRMLPAVVSALLVAGTQITVVCPVQPDAGWSQRLEVAGFRAVDGSHLDRQVMCGADHAGRALAAPLQVWQAGARMSRVRPCRLDFEAIRPFLDPADRGVSAPKEEKAALAYSPLPWEPWRWANMRLPEDVVRMMTEGVSVDTAEGAVGSVDQYPWPDDRSRLQCEAESATVLYG